MARVPNRDRPGNTALKLAAWHGNKETLEYLLTVIPDLPPPGCEDGTSPYTGVAGGDLITLTIMSGFLDVALKIIDMHPNIVLEYDRNKETALQALAMKPANFLSGSRLGFCGRLIYSLIPLKKSQEAHKVNILSSLVSKFAGGFWRGLTFVAPTIKKIHDSKVTHAQSNLLVKRICEIVIGTVNHDKVWKTLGNGICTAVKYGAYELIEECIITYPGIIWYSVEGLYLFHAAIKERQERVYNIVYQMSDHKVFVATRIDKGKNENVLHMAANLAPPHRLNVVTGAALQMQRELQWFQVKYYISYFSSGY